MTITPILDPLDECECGDYRREHEGGTGRCRMPDDLCHGFKPCLQFRLSKRAGAEHRELRIGDRVPMPPRPKLKVSPTSFADSSAKGPRGVFTNGRGKS